MRRDDTRAERQAWMLLKDRRTLGLKFRRQVPIDRYIVDFYCHESRLIIELDGGVHDQPGQAEWDAARNARLDEPGYRVLHITNQDLFNHPDCLLEMIRAWYPSPGQPAGGLAGHPLPSGEGS